MNDQELNLLEAAYDLHVHSFPDLMSRTINDFELADKARAAGMAGFVLKSHYFPTTERAWLVQEATPGIRVIGSLVLNHFVGGLNPLAVEATARAGGRIIFMPTSDTSNESHLLEDWDYESAALPPYLQIKKELQDAGRLPEPISLVTADGQLSSDTRAVLEAVRDHDLVLATGHIGLSEIKELLPEAKKMGISRILVTHPDSPSINLDFEQQQFCVDNGALLERCFAYLSNPEKMSRALESVTATGAANNILSSDLGAIGRADPVTGLEEFARLAISASVSMESLRQMICSNPKELLG